MDLPIYQQPQGFLFVFCPFGLFHSNRGTKCDRLASSWWSLICFTQSGSWPTSLSAADSMYIGCLRTTEPLYILSPVSKNFSPSVCSALQEACAPSGQCIPVGCDFLNMLHLKQIPWHLPVTPGKVECPFSTVMGIMENHKGGLRVKPSTGSQLSLRGIWRWCWRPHGLSHVSSFKRLSDLVSLSHSWVNFAEGLHARSLHDERCCFLQNEAGDVLNTSVHTESCLGPTPASPLLCNFSTFFRVFNTAERPAVCRS